MDVLKSQLPKRIADRYEVIEPIGSGGVGAVLKCKDRVLNNFVAVKILHTDATDEVATRFQREARAAANLRHQNLVHIIDCGQNEKGQLFLVMEYLEGATLYDSIQHNGPFELTEFLPLLKQICEGLNYAHKRGVLHRDIKPTNIMLVEQPDGSKHVKIIDFGLAKVATLSEDQIQVQGATTGGRVFGSPAYISPEGARGEPLDLRTDLYSLGCLIFEALTGRTPFSGLTAFETMSMRLHNPAPSLSQRSSRVFEPEVEAAIATCLAIEPVDRPDSAISLFESFEQASLALEQIRDSAISVSPFEQSSVYRAKKRRLSLFSQVLIAGFVLALIGYFVFTIVRLTGDDESQTLESGKDGDDLGRFESDQFLFRNERDDDGVTWTSIGGLKFARELEVLKTSRDVRYLHLKKRTLIGPGLSYLERVPLRGLDVDGSILNNDSLSYIGRINSLEILVLSNCDGFDDRGLVYLESLPKLKKLNLKRTRITDEAFHSLAKMSELQELNLQSCRGVTGANLQLLSTVSKLEALNMARTFVEPRSLSTLKFLPALRGLDLKDLSLCDKDMEFLKLLKVNTLDLSYNVITDKSLASFAENKYLRRLNLHDCMRVTSDGIKALTSKRPDLRVEH